MIKQNNKSVSNMLSVCIKIQILIKLSRKYSQSSSSSSSSSFERISSHWNRSGLKRFKIVWALPFPYNVVTRRDDTILHLKRWDFSKLNAVTTCDSQLAPILDSYRSNSSCELTISITASVHQKQNMPRREAEGAKKVHGIWGRKNLHDAYDLQLCVMILLLNWGGGGIHLLNSQCLQKCQHCSKKF
jgi:hypothetical protein